MEAKWFTSSTYICNVCNASKDVLEILEEGIDSVTHIPYGMIKMSCGHTQKYLRVSREFNVAPLFRKRPISVRPVVVDGVPSLTVSGAGSTAYVGNQIIIDQSKNIFNIYSNMNQSFNTQTTIGTNNLEDIFTRIDKENYSTDEKDKIKGALTKIDSIIRSLDRISDKAGQLALVGMKSPFWQKVKVSSNTFF